MHEYEAWDDLPDPWEGDHDIEYWVWQDDRLIPAPPDDLARITEDERTREALFRLEQVQQCEQREAHDVTRRLATLRAWCASGLRVTVQWLRIRRRHGLVPHREGARAERSSTR